MAQPVRQTGPAPFTKGFVVSCPRGTNHDLSHPLGLDVEAIAAAKRGTKKNGHSR